MRIRAEFLTVLGELNSSVTELLPVTSRLMEKLCPS